MLKLSELLNSRDKWTQNCNARNEWGLPTTADEPEACSWCLNGAIIKCFGRQFNDYPIYHTLNDLAEERGYTHLIDLNDRGSYEEVIGVVREAERITDEAQ